MKDEQEAIAMLIGFATGTAASGLSIVAALTGFFALAGNNVGGLEGNALLGLSVAMIVLGVLLSYGALRIWRFSVHGGALNLSLSIISILLVIYHSNALSQAQPSQGTLFYYNWLLYPSIVVTSMASGVAGVYAHREQIYKRLTPQNA